MKNLLSEELKRYRILSNYNTKLTLTENTEIVSKNSILNEGPLPGVTLKAVKARLRKLSQSLDSFNLTMKATEIEKYLLMDEKAFERELTKQMKYDIKMGNTTMVSANELSKIQVLKEITLKKPTTVPEMNKIIDDIKIRNDTKFKALESLNKIKPPTGGKNTKPPKKNRQKTPPVIPNKPTNWTLFTKQITGWGTIGAILAGLFVIGGVYLAHKWWLESKEQPSMFPDCIRKNIPEEDFKKMIDEKLNYALIADTGNDTIDQYGGGKFFDNKKFVTGNGKYTGTWEDTGSGIVITVGGTGYAMSCEGMIDDDVPKTDDDVPKTDDGSTTTTTTIYTPEKNAFFGDDILN